MLETQHRSADLGNLTDPLAEIVYIVLSRQTREVVYQEVFRQLRLRFPTWLSVLSAPSDEVLRVISPAGLQNQRLRQLQAMLAAVLRDNLDRGVGAAQPPSDLTLAYLRDLSDLEAEAFLCKLPGVGLKTARCVLSYALERPAFAVDTHVERIVTRLGWIPPSSGRLKHNEYQEIVPSPVRRRLHVNLVHHGRAVCRTRKPRCEECVLRVNADRKRARALIENGSAVVGS